VTMPENQNIDEVAIKELDAVDAIMEKENRVLSRLLDNKLTIKGQIFALRGEMGETSKITGGRQLTPSYLAIHTLDWAGTNIKLGSQMPFMETSIDEEGRLVVDEGNAEEIKQRAPDWTRQPALSAYLMHDKSRKFSSILAVVSPAWIDDPNHENWSKDGTAIKSAVSFHSLDSAGKIGLLDLSNAHVYALDGQHRIMGIRGIQDIRDDGKMEMRKKDGRATGKVISREEFLAEFRSDITKMQSLLNETIGVEYIPAVIAGENRKEASQRVRSIFVAINAYAKKTSKGEGILLDESNGYAIIARNIMVSHSLFKNKTPKGEARVHLKSKSLPKSSEAFTTLDAINEIAINYLKFVRPELAVAWTPRFKGQVPIRPEEHEIEDAKELVEVFLTHLEQLPVFQGILSGDPILKIRNFPSDTEKDNSGHLLTRPIGQIMLARVAGALVHDGMNLDDIFEKVKNIDLSGGFKTHLPENVWYCVTYDPMKKKMKTSARDQELATKLLHYLLVGATADVRKELVREIIEARKDEGGRMTNFAGERVPAEINQVHLPVPAM